jgi:hypothetical protein
VRRVVPTSLVLLGGIAACNAILGNEERRVDEEAFDATTGDATPRADGAAPLDGATMGDGGGDGTVSDGGVDADGDAAPVFIGCLGDAGCDRVMFVTAQSFMGNLGGAAGADARCQAAADKSTLARIKGRAYRAWISTSAEAARNRHVHGTQKYFRANGTTVLADNWDDLVLNGPAVAITDEQDNFSSKGAWTGTANDGDKVADTCTDWTSTATSGLTGNPDQPATWSSDPPAENCDVTATLICIER